MIKTIAAASLILFAAAAQAQSSSTAQQQATSASTAQGTIEFSQTPADTTETVRNVSAPILGAYAASFSQMNCGQTAQAGLAVAGVSLAGGASKDSHTCVLEVAAAESVRQSTVTSDPALKTQLQKAATLIRCEVSDEVKAAYEAAGIDCTLTKPAPVAQQQYYRVAQTQ